MMAKANGGGGRRPEPSVRRPREGTRDDHGEGTGTVSSENQRRAADTLRVRDVVVRAASAVGLIAAALAALLAIQPA